MFERCGQLAPAQVEHLCRAVLPIAGRLTTGQIAHRLLRLIHEIDPGHLDRRYRRAVRDRQVICYLDRDGTATLSARGLPPDHAAAAVGRVDGLARALRRAGHPHTLDQLRADIVLGLLDGSLHGLTREEIIQTLLTGGSPPTPDDQRTGIEIRVPLTTLLGLDDRAGEIPALGHIPAHAARATVARQRRAPWRWVVVDTDGMLLTEGITRRRPGHLTRTGPRGGVVELQVPETTLDRLAADAQACGPWAGVVADIAAQHHRMHRDPAARLRDLDAHPRDRRPRAALRRHVQVRDRTCVHPGCRGSACMSDQDHTLEHGHGGTTTTDDLGPSARSDGSWWSSISRRRSVRWRSRSPARWASMWRICRGWRCVGSRTCTRASPRPMPATRS